MTQCNWSYITDVCEWPEHRNIMCLSRRNFMKRKTHQVAMSMPRTHVCGTKSCLMFRNVKFKLHLSNRLKNQVPTYPINAYKTSKESPKLKICFVHQGCYHSSWLFDHNTKRTQQFYHSLHAVAYTKHLHKTLKI